MSSSGVIKVADFGLTEDMYQNDYYRQISGGIKLPIKWMALESIHNRHFSEKSDVVGNLHSLYVCNNYKLFKEINHKIVVSYIVITVQIVITHAVGIWSHLLGSVQPWSVTLSYHESRRSG